MMPCSFFLVLWLPFLVQHHGCQNTSVLQMQGDESYASGCRIRLLHSQTEGADSKMRCQTWRDGFCSLWTPPCSSVTRSHSRSAYRFNFRPLSHIPYTMSVSGCGELGYGNPQKFSPRKSHFQAIRESFLPWKKPAIRYSITTRGVCQILALLWCKSEGFTSAVPISGM